MKDEGIVERLKSDIWAGEKEWQKLPADKRGSVDDHKIDVPIRRLVRAMTEIEKLREERGRYREALEHIKARATHIDCCTVAIEALEPDNE